MTLKPKDFIYQPFSSSLAEYVKAAQILKDKDSPIKLAKVEGPEESDLLEKMHVTGYPTIFFYRDGEPVKYTGNEMHFMFNIGFECTQKIMKLKKTL